VTTFDFDDADQVVATYQPRDATTGPERKTTFNHDKIGNLLSLVEPSGNLTSTAGDYTTTYGYDEMYEITSVTNALTNKITYTYDDVGNVTTVVDPRKNATPDTTDYTRKFSYDLNHQVRVVTDATGKSRSTHYDLDGLVDSTADQNGAATLITLDARGKATEVKVPHKNSGGTITYNTTRYEYDQVGNQTRVISPRGVATTSVPDDFVQETTYDELNRVKEKISPFDPGDTRYNTPSKTIYTYDAVGRVAKVSAPPSEGQTVRNDTTYSYWDNGWVRTSTDPWDIATGYDYNALGQQISRSVTSAGGSSSRTMTWDYFPDGKLRTRSDSGVPVGKQVVLVDNSDIQNVGATGTWPASSFGTGYQGYNYATHAAGTGTSSFAWNLIIPQDGNYDVYARYAAGTATNATYKVDYSGGSATKTVNQTTSAGSWVSLGKYAFSKTSNAQKVTLTDNANGTVVADAVKLVRDNAADTDNEQKDFTYGYDPNGNLVDISDRTPGANTDDYAVTYTGLNMMAKVEEKKSGALQHTTTFDYDENGNPKVRGHDSASASYEYDVRDLIAKITETTSASDPSPKVSTFTYTPTADLLHEVKGNGNTVDYDYFLDGLLQHQIEKKSNGTVVAEHTLDYDPNSNKTADVARKMNADNHAAYISRTTNYQYDPLDRLAKITRSDGTSETYTHDANNNVVSQTVKGTTTNFSYDRNRLLTAVVNGVTAKYNYDPFGRLDTVIANNQVVEENVYDGFDRVSEHTGLSNSGSTTTTKFAHDPLDRTTAQTTNASTASEKTTNFSYLALSQDVLSEDVAGRITKSYQYSPWGERLSQVKFNPDGSSEDVYYGYNDHTDVEDITDKNGDTKATYGYTAYGQDDTTEFSGADKPDAQDPTKEPYNAYRFNAKRWDPTFGKYDMGFREYDPGLNRFLTRDLYNGALSDLRLTTDPFTGNRYAFGGGNPVTFIEIDGHCSGWNPMSCAWDALSNGFQEHVMKPFDEAVSGFSDTVTFGATNWLRDRLYGDDSGIDESSGWYKFGEWGGIATSFSGLLKGGIKVAAKLLRKRATEEALEAVPGIARSTAKAAPGVVAATGKVAYGSTDLAQIAINYRKANNIRGAVNIAVFEFESNGRLYTIARQSSRTGQHAERAIWTELEKLGIRSEQVKRIYSELEPCDKPGGYCNRWIQRTFPKAKVSWSFDYAGDAAAAAIEALKRAVAAIFK